MLLIDGVKYHEWTPPNEDALEQIIIEHAQDIFGKESIYFDLKKKLTTKAGISSIPDGYVISFSGIPCWYICEVELHGHPLYEHIVPQVTKFISGIKSFETQREIINALDKEINADKDKIALIKNKTNGKEIYRFLSNLISQPPKLAILIDKQTKELEEVCESLPIHANVIEFQTFKVDNIKNNHAHSLESLYPITYPAPPKWGKWVQLKDLLELGILKAGQELYRTYKDRKYVAVITINGGIKILGSDIEYISPSAAAKPIAGSVDGWTWWLTTHDGTECLLDKLREEYKMISNSVKRE